MRICVAYVLGAPKSKRDAVCACLVGELGTGDVRALEAQLEARKRTRATVVDARVLRLAPCRRSCMGLGTTAAEVVIPSPSLSDPFDEDRFVATLTE
jgi:hypothetical protein